MILLFTFLNLYAQSVVIQSEDTTNFEYQKHLTEHPTQMSFVQYHSGLVNNQKDKILGELKKAQFEFLEGTLEKSQRHFRNIVQLQHKANWDEQERKAIHFAFLRLAQLAKNQIKQKSLLLQAISFDPDLKIDEDIFPPPLVTRFLTLSRGLKKQVWPLPKGSEVFDKILVNGKKRRGDSSFIELPKGPHRIQFLSNRYLPVHFVIKSQELEALKLPIKPLATGPCQSPHFDKSLSHSNQFIYLKQQCTGQFNPFSEPNVAIRNLPSLKPKKEKAFYQSKWFWIGFSVLASGIAISHYNNQNKNSGSSAPVANTPYGDSSVQTFTNR